MQPLIEACSLRRFMSSTQNVSAYCVAGRYRQRRKNEEGNRPARAFMALSVRWLTAIRRVACRLRRSPTSGRFVLCATCGVAFIERSWLTKSSASYESPPSATLAAADLRPWRNRPRRSAPRGSAQSIARPRFASAWSMWMIWSSRALKQSFCRCPAAPCAASNHAPPSDGATRITAKRPDQFARNQAEWCRATPAPSLLASLYPATKTEVGSRRSMA